MMNETILASVRGRLLARYTVLAALPASEVDDLCRTRSLQLPAGAELFAEHSPCLGFPLVLEGSVKVLKSSPSGRAMLLYRVEAGGSCIITSSCLIGHLPYSARGVADTPLSLLILPPALFERLLADYPDFRAFVFRLFGERIAELMLRVEEVAFQRLDQRLARLLLARVDNPIRSTHQALAEELGSVREIVSRLLKTFADQGMLTLAREQIVLVDRERLQHLADAER